MKRLIFSFQILEDYAFTKGGHKKMCETEFLIREGGKDILFPIPP